MEFADCDLTGYRSPQRAVLSGGDENWLWHNTALARIFGGLAIPVSLLTQNVDGSWQVSCQANTPRSTFGTVITVMQSEIIG